jgi:ATP-dependent exoDNAse (exonuclease V) beta subunit
VESFQRICYKSDFYLDKKTVEFACNSVRRRKVTFLDALKDQAKRFDRISRQVRNFEDYVRTTSRMGSLEFLQYLDGNGYGTYMQKNHLDHNKFDLLLALADENPAVPDFLTRLNELRELTADNVQDAKAGIFLTTAHSSKGLEYDTVYLMDIYDGQFPGSDAVEILGRKQNMDLVQEERRLFYVAITRAKNQLHVFSIKGKPSSFVDEILPPPEAPKSTASQKSRYSIDQYRLEQEKRAREQAEIKQRIAEELKKRMDSQQKRSPIEHIQTAPVPDAEEHLKTHAVAEYGNLPVKTVKSVEQILNENYDQEEYLIYDMVGFRRMKCVVCGAIQPEKEFVKHDTCNKGTCRKCASGK